MLPRKQRILLMIAIPAFAILIIAVVLMFILLKTDFMKSNDVLFKKYFSQNFSAMSTIANFKEIETNNNIIKTNDYKISSNTKISTSSSNNAINLIMNGSVKNSSDIAYSNIQLKSNDNKLFEVEYEKQGNIYGVRFSDFFKQYISVENNNLKSLAQKLGIQEYALQYIPDSIDENMNILEDLSFTDEELKQLYSKYSQVLLENISKDKYEKQKDALITVDNVSLNTNAYKITLNGEDYNNITSNLLQSLKQDEIIMSKVDKLQNKLGQIIEESDFSQKSLKEEFIENIDKAINENSAPDDYQLVIMVYENKGRLVRTLIEDGENKVIIDRVSTGTQEKISFENIVVSENKTTGKIELIRNNDMLDVIISNIDDQNKQTIQFSNREQRVDNTINRNFNILYKNGDDSITIESSNIINLKEAEEIIALDDNNNIILNNLEEEQLKRLLSTVTEQIMPSLQRVFVEVYGLISSEQLSASTYDEKDEFNTLYKQHEGEGLESYVVKDLMDLAKKDLKGIEVVDNNTLKIFIEKDNLNSDLAQKISNTIKDGSTYTVKLEYDGSGYVNTVILIKE